MVFKGTLPHFSQKMTLPRTGCFKPTGFAATTCPYSPPKAPPARAGFSGASLPNIYIYIYIQYIYVYIHVYIQYIYILKKKRSPPLLPSFLPSSGTRPAPWAWGRPRAPRWPCRGPASTPRRVPGRRRAPRCAPAGAGGGGEEGRKV